MSSSHPREDVRNKSGVSGVSGDFPVQRSTRLPDWSAGGLLRCSAAARLSGCRCRFPKSRYHEHDAHDLLWTSLRGSSSDTSDKPDFLVNSSRHPREDVTRMLEENWSRGIRALPNRDQRVATVWSTVVRHGTFHRRRVRSAASCKIGLHAADGARN